MSLLQLAARKPVAAAGLGAAALWTLLAFTSWKTLFNGPRVGSPWELYEANQAFLFSGAVQAAPIVGAALLIFAAAVIGYGLVVRPIWGDRGLVSATWGLFAGVIPGGLLMIAVFRAVTLVVPNGAAPILLGVATLAVAGAVGVRLLRDARDTLSLGSALKQGWPALAALAVALIWSIHIDRAHALAEGSLWFIQEVFLKPEHGPGSAGVWPLFSQHYDEAMFLYPVVYGLVTPGETAPLTLVTIYWLMLAAGRVAIASLAYVALRGLGADRPSAVCLLVFAGGASLSLNPLSSSMLFDSLNPLAYVLHISRIVAPLLPLLLVSAAINQPRRGGLPALAVAAVLGAGLASMTIHIALVMAWAAALAAAVALSPAAARSATLLRCACVAAVILLAAFSIAYGLVGAPGMLRAGALLAGAAAAGAAMAWALWSARAVPRGQEQPGGSTLFILAALLCGYGVGLLFFGNILVDRTFPILSGVWPWSGTEVLERYYSTLGRPTFGVTPLPHCETGYPWESRTLTGHCSSLPLFARTYGLGLVATTFVFAWLLLRPAKASVPERSMTILVWALAACLLAQPLSFFLYDFVTVPDWGDRNLSVWLRSRLVEPWFYSGALLALTLFLREADARARRIGQSLLLFATAMFALNPATMPAQLAINLVYMLSAPFGR